MSVVIAKVLFGILCVGTSVMLTYVGVKALRTGSHIERGVRYTGKSARQIGWFYIVGAVLCFVMTMIALIVPRWR